MSKKLIKNFVERLEQLGVSNISNLVLNDKMLSNTIMIRLKGLDILTEATKLSSSEKSQLKMILEFESLPLPAAKRLQHLNGSLDLSEVKEDEKAEIIRLVEKFQNMTKESNEKLNILKDAYHFPYSRKKYIENLIKDRVNSSDHTVDHLEILNNLYKEILTLSFHTEYGMKILAKNSLKSQKMVLKQIKKLEKEQDLELSNMLHLNPEKLKDLKKKLKKVEARPERGIETLFRLASKNLYTRSRLVDAKSSIMISVNAIILSIILGSLYPHLDEDPHLLYAIIPLFLTNLSSIAFAIFAARPKLRFSYSTTKDVKEKRAQLLTFDDFFYLKKEEYEWAMEELMNDADYLYKSLSRDIYDLGKELGIKYEHIRNSYNIFLIGLSISIAMFLLCHWLF